MLTSTVLYTLTDIPILNAVSDADLFTVNLYSVGVAYDIFCGLRSYEVFSAVKPSPLSPLSPVSPVSPLSPVSPVSPMSPGCPTIPSVSIVQLLL